MLKFYSEKDVRKIVARLKGEYEDALLAQRRIADTIKEENASLKARLSVLERERAQVTATLVHAVNAGEKLRRDGEIELENKRRELSLLVERCRLLSERVKRLLPNREEGKELEQFTAAFMQNLGVKEEESGLDMNEVLAPDYPLDLEKLCKEMGVMED